MADLEYSLGLDPAGFGNGVRAGIGMAGDLANAMRGLADLWQATLDVFADTAAFEQTTVAINTMTKSMAVTRSVMRDLADFAAKTPFELPEIASAARQLIGAGVAVKDVKEELRILGDISAGAGTDIGGIVTVMNQVRGKAVLLTDDFQQLAERGVAGLRQELAKVKGIEVEAVAKAMSDGKISADDLMEAFRTMTAEGGNYFRSMEAQSETFTGKLSSMQDALGAFMREFEAPALELMKPVLDGISAQLAGMTGEAKVFMATLKQSAQDGQLGEFLELSVSLGLAKAWQSFMTIAYAGVDSLAESIAAPFANQLIAFLNKKGLSQVLFGGKLEFQDEGNFGENFLLGLQGNIDELGKRMEGFQSAPREDIARQELKDRIEANVAANEDRKKRDAEATAKAKRDKIASEKAFLEEAAKAYDKQQGKNRKTGTMPKVESHGMSRHSSAEQAAIRSVRPIADGAKKAGDLIGNAAERGAKEIANAIKGPDKGGTEGRRIMGYSRERQGGADAARTRAQERVEKTRRKSQEQRSKMGSLAGLYGRPGNTFGNLDYAKDIATAQNSTTPTRVEQNPYRDMTGQGSQQQQATLNEIVNELRRITTK